MVSQIMLIENNPPIQTMFAEASLDADWELLIYSYAEVEFKSISLIHPALIVLDFKSETAEIAWGFLQMLKMDDANAEIPIIITTSLDPLTAEIRAYLALQYIHVVYTPYELDKLIGLIRDILNASNQSRLDYVRNEHSPILVVEDNEDLREALKEILGLEGYQVVTADNGLLALDAIYKAEHSLIFLDIQMPVMDGFEFLQIYARQLRPHRPVVVLSADTSILSYTFPSFVVDVQPKPYVIEDLLVLTEKYT